MIDARTLSTAPRGEGGAAAATARGRLTVVHPRGLAWQLVVDDARVVIGRQPGDGGATLPHDTVSRRHFAIEWSAVWRSHVLVDLGSRNGVRVGGRAVGAEQRLALEHGVVIAAGDVVLVYERGEVDAAGPDAADAAAIAAIPGDSIAVHHLRRAVARAAPDPSPVLLIGPTGAGKEWIAREVHRLSGRRGQLVAVNCAALSPQLIESQLFGHVRGAFTGATTDQEGLFRAAHGGTLMLDEIGELPDSLQPKLLRVLQEREVQPVGSTRTVGVDVRVVAATNRDLAGEVEAGRFRRDLYARLALFELRVPALRERRVDLVTWIERLRAAWHARRGTTAAPLALSADAAEAILLHDWPENLRGLDRLIHHLEVTVPAGRPVPYDALPEWLTAPRPDAAAGATAPSQPAGPAPRRRTPAADELRALLAQHDGNVAAVARHYGCDRRQIYRWMDALGIPRAG